MKITECINLSDKSVLAVIGCGGKTSLIELVARSCRDKKVLITPTTKIFPMRQAGVTMLTSLRECEEHRPHTGIQCLGVLNSADGKLTALPERILEEIIPRYDIALLEADGSRGLPCKGWLKSEPVIPTCCTHTVGVVTIKALGLTATSLTVHNLPEFSALTGLKKGDAITMESLESMACGCGGMFKNSVGKRYLLVNQAESGTAAQAAARFLLKVKEKHPERFDGLIYGSVYHDYWRKV